MGRSVRVAAIAAAMLFSLPAAAFADAGTQASAAAPVPVAPTSVAADCPVETGQSGGTGSGEPSTGGGGAGPDDKSSGSGSGDQGSGSGSGGQGSGGDSGGQDSGDGSGDQGSGGGSAGSGSDSGGQGSGGQGEGAPAAAPAASTAPGVPGASATPGQDGPGDGSGDSGGNSGDGGSGDTGGAGGDQGSGGDEKTTGEKTTGEKPGGSGDDASGGDDSGGEQPGGGDAGSGKAGEAPAGCAPAGGAVAVPAEAPAAPAAPAPPAAPPAPSAPGAAAYPGAETSAASMLNWGEPNKVDEFDGELTGWNMYDGEGHAGEGRRSPEAVSTKDGILTINGDAQGTTGGMAWSDGSQKYGRWEGRVRAPASDPSYNALLLLWPTAENFPVGGEVDFMEMTDHTRQKTELFLHYGEDNSQVQGVVDIDATQWHNWAVEWRPDGITAFVDGKPWWHTDDTSILPPGPMHLTVQLDWFPEGEGPVKPSKMEVDWVRQYPLPESQPGGAAGGGSGGGSGGNDEGVLDRIAGLPGRITEGSPDAGSATRGPSGP